MSFREPHQVVVGGNQYAHQVPAHHALRVTAAPLHEGSIQGTDDDAARCMYQARGACAHMHAQANRHALTGALTGLHHGLPSSRVLSTNWSH